MFKNKLAAVIMAVFTAITFSVAAQTAEAKPVRPAPGQVLVPPQVRETAELQKISKRFDIDASVLQTDVGRILRTFKIKKNVEVTDNGKIII